MILGCEHNGSDCAHASAPNCQPLDLQVLVGLSEHCLCVCGFVESVREVSIVAVAAPHKVKGNDGE